MAFANGAEHVAKQTEPLAATQTQAVPPQIEDIEVLAARLRKRFMNEQLESDWNKHSIGKM